MRTQGILLLLLSGAMAMAVGCGDDDSKDSGTMSGGSAGTGGGSSGTGGGPSELAAFGLLFSVAPGAEGVPETGVADAAPNAQSNLYRSSGSGSVHLQGTNALGFTAADLGLDPSDDVDAISIVHQAVPSAFFFSVVDQPSHDEGVDGTAVRRASTDAEVKADIFVTFALAPPSGNGANISWVDEFRLGLLPQTEGAASDDDLNALDVEVPASPVPLLFSVGAGAVGAEASAVASVPAAERGCTIFSSNLDGTNSVVWTCAELGLEPDDEIDALVVLGVGDEPRTALFSVSPDSVGATGSGVAAQAGEAAADIFVSDGSGTNQLYIEERALGLLPDDDLDALAIRSAGDPEAAWLPPPPPPENPPPSGQPPACPFPPTTLSANPGAEQPQAHSNESIPPKVAHPQTRIRRRHARARRLSQADADRLNALRPCNSRRAANPLPGGVDDPRVEVMCPPGAQDFVPGNVVIGVIETEQPLNDQMWPVIQAAMIVDTDNDASNNYEAQAPYTKDPFDATDLVIQIQKPPSGTLAANTQDIANNVFTPLTGVANRVTIFGNYYEFIMQVPDGDSFPLRFMVFGADADYGQSGGEWSMSPVNPVGEPMLIAPFESCP